MVLRILGVESEEAWRLSTTDLPPLKGFFQLFS
jgi:hypothetical protein